MTDLLFFGAALLLALTLRVFVLSLTRIKGRSMLPTLADRSWTLVWRMGLRFRAPKRHEVVICHYPNRYWRGYKFLPMTFVKRVIGLPGETVEIIEGVVHIDGEPLDEPYLDPRYTRFTRSRPPRTLGPDEYFVMGDNRDASNDSRSVGPLKRRAILGRVLCTFWPLSRLSRVK